MESVNLARNLLKIKEIRITSWNLMLKYIIPWIVKSILDNLNGFWLINDCATIITVLLYNGQLYFSIIILYEYRMIDDNSWWMINIE